MTTPRLRILIAAFALPLLAAAPALAVEFHSELETTRLTGAAPAAFNDKFTWDAGTLECENITYTGTLTGKTSKEFHAAPTYSGCTSTFGASVTIDPNGCEFVFTTGGVKEVRQLLCPAGKVTEVTSPGCLTTFPAQTLENGITWTSETVSGKKRIIVDINANGIVYEEHQRLLHTCHMETGLTSNGTLTGSVTFTGESTEGVLTNIWRE